MIDEPAEIVDYVHKNEFINAKRFPVAVNWGINSGDNQGLCKTITRNRQNLHLKKIHTSTSACLLLYAAQVILSGKVPLV